MVDRQKRKSISKKDRFEIFKRDGFTCIYCGNVPPRVVLEVDHVIPVSKGGSNHIDNLVSSCMDCNRGKSNRELTDAVQPIVDKIEMAKERAIQYKEYCKLLNDTEKRIQVEIEQISDIYSSVFVGLELTDVFKNSSLKRFIKDIGYHEVRDAMYKACMNVNHSQQCIKYFCGICWNIIKNKGYSG